MHAAGLAQSTGVSRFWGPLSRDFFLPQGQMGVPHPLRPSTPSPLPGALSGLGGPTSAACACTPCPPASSHPPNLTRYPVGLPGGGSQLKWIFRDPAALALGFCGAPRSPRGGGGDDTVWFITLRSSSSAGCQAGQSAETPLWLWGGRNPSTPPGGTRRLVKQQDSFPLTSHHLYGCERWTIKSTEHQSTDAFELCWRRLLRVLGLQGDPTSPS